MNQKNDYLMCSFCGSPILAGENEESNPGMIGIDAAICYSCIDIYYHIMQLEENEYHLENDKLEKKFPRDFYKAFNECVVGQEKAKKALSVALYNHYQRISHSNTEEIEKSNVLLIGPSGSGKTLLAQTMAKLLNVPFAICDATVYTEAGYVGEDVEGILLKLLQNADYDLERAEKGIIFIDEIDKLARKGENVSITRDVSGEGVQNALLKIIEGSIINVPPQGGRKHPYQEYIHFDTTNVLFICAGAFDGIGKIKNNVVGIKKQLETDETVTVQELIKYGIIPELLGRLPVIVSLDELKESDLISVLSEPKNAIIKLYQALLGLSDVNLTFTDEALKSIAHKAYLDHNGARSLRRIIEALMQNVIFELDDEKLKNHDIIITSENVNCINM